MATKTTSLSTEVKPADGGVGNRKFFWEVLDNDDLDREFRQRLGFVRRLSLTLNPSEIYVDLFPANANIRTFSTSGSLVGKSFGKKFIREELEFINSDTVSFRYEGISDLVIDRVGQFFDEDGNAFTPSFTYNGASSELVADKKCFGKIQITYKASHYRFKFIFNGACPFEFGKGSVATKKTDALSEAAGELEEIPLFEPSLLVALWEVEPDNVINTTMSVENPNARCGGSSSTSIYFEDDETGIELIVLGTELDPTDNNLGIKTAVTTVLAFPSGEIDAVDGIIVDEEVDFKFIEKRQREIKKDYVQFNNTFRQRMKLPIKDGASLHPNPVTRIIDQFGRDVTFGVKFKKPGERVRLATWTSSFTFEDLDRDVEVQPGDLVVTNSFGYTMPVTGVIEISYTAEFDIIRVFRDIKTDIELQEIGADPTILAVKGKDDKQAKSIILPLYVNGNTGKPSTIDLAVE